MLDSVLKILTFALYPAFAVVAGSMASLLKSPGPAVSSAIQHFSAGVIFSALATELLPDVMHRRMPIVTLIGFTLGVIAMLLIKHWTSREEKQQEGAKSQPTSLLIAMGVDILLDGILIGIGFAAGEKQGMLLTIAIGLELLFLGLSSSAAMHGAGTSRPRIIIVALILAAILLLGAGLGALILSNASGTVLDAVMAFGLAALLYLVTEELLVEAHESPETPLQTAMFFVGFIALLLIEMFL